MRLIALAYRSHQVRSLGRVSSITHFSHSHPPATYCLISYVGIYIKVIMFSQSVLPAFRMNTMALPVSRIASISRSHHARSLVPVANGLHQHSTNTIAAASSTSAQQLTRFFSSTTPENPDSVYARIGGEPAIDAAVEIFYKKIQADESIAYMFADTNWKRQKAHQKKFLTQALGGPKNYSGETMRNAHKHVNKGEFPTEDHFNAVAGHLVSTLQELGVEQSMIDEVVAVVLTTKADVLGQ